MDSFSQANVEAGLELTSNLLESLGAKPRNLTALTDALRTQFDLRSTALAKAIEEGGGHDGPSTSDNEVFKLNEDALPQVRNLPLNLVKGFALGWAPPGLWGSPWQGVWLRKDASWPTAARAQVIPLNTMPGDDMACPLK
jgi:hypothetical protein